MKGRHNVGDKAERVKGTPVDQKFGGQGGGRGQSSACGSSLGPGQSLVGLAGLSSPSDWEEGPPQLCQLLSR